MASLLPLRHPFHIHFLAILFACWVFIPNTMAFGGEPSTIHLLSYHNHPPFVTGPNEGLSYDMARLLTEFSAGTWTFRVRILPRNRLDLELAPWIQGRCPNPSNPPECHDDWSLLWVNPSWGFGAGAEERFRWLKIFSDSNAILSLKDSPVAYQTPESLIGLRLGGMRGHHYIGLDDLVSAGKIQRFDGDHERDNLLKLLLKRLDVILLPASTTNYFLTKDETIRKSADKFYIAPVRHQHFLRHFMIPSTRNDLEKLYKNWLATEPFSKEITGE